MVEAKTLSVHRCRFVDFTPAGVTALAFPPLSLPSPKGKKAVVRHALKFANLAVGRANGNIEICEWTGSENELRAPQAWVVKKTIAGPYPSKVDSLAFTLRNPYEVSPDETPSLSDLRLFSAGGGNELAEWDIDRACIKRTLPSQGGSIWCISPNPASTMLAIGCEDGAIRLISIEHDTLQHVRRLDRVKSRILSLAWGPPVPKQASTTEQSEDTDDDNDDDWTDSWIVAGCSDSSVRRWDVATGRVGERMGTDKMKGERTLVWTVGVLGDGTIISGDSLGMVKFWDSRTGTQLQSFQAHGADVLCMTINPEGTAVYTSGVDQKVVEFHSIKTTSTEQSSILSRSSTRWIQSVSRRLHSHDVRALAIWPSYSPLPPSHRRQFPLDVAPVVASGGLDMSVIVTPAALPTSTITKVINPLETSQITTFEDSYQRRLPYSSGPYNSSAVHLARQARLLLCQRDAGASIWRILPKHAPTYGEDGLEELSPAAEGGWEPVIDLDLVVNTNIVASAISDDGEWVVVSDWYESKLFHMERLPNGQLKPKRIRDFASILEPHLPSTPASTGASCFVFAPDSRKLVMASAISSYILVIDLASEKPRVLRRFEHHRMQNIVLGERVVKGRQRSQDAEDVEMQDTTAGEKAEDADESDEDVDPPKPVIATVTRMAVSPDGQWLATSDDHRRTHVFNLDSVQYHCVLPSFPQLTHALAFDRASPSTLVLGLANNTVQVFDVESRTFPAWARELTAALPRRFTHLHDPILGVAFDAPAKRGSALFWGATWLCRVQLDAGVGFDNFDKKRRWGAPKPAPKLAAHQDADGAPTFHQDNFKLVTHYRPILFADFIGPAELVVVERPLVDVLAKLPPAFFKPKYGAT